MLPLRDGNNCSIQALRHSEVMELQGRATGAWRGARAARDPSRWRQLWGLAGGLWVAQPLGKQGGDMNAAVGQAGALGQLWSSPWPQDLHLRQDVCGSPTRPQGPARTPQQHASCSCQQDRSHLLLSPSPQPQLPLPPSWETVPHWLQLYHTALGTAEGERASPASFLLSQRMLCQSFLRGSPLMSMQSRGKRYYFLTGTRTPAWVTWTCSLAPKRDVSPSECESSGVSRDASDAFKGCVIISTAENHCSTSRNINAPKSSQIYCSLRDWHTHILYYTSS